MEPQILATWTYVCGECKMQVQLTDEYHDGLPQPYNLAMACDKAEKLGWERHSVCSVVDSEAFEWRYGWLCSYCQDEMREAGLL